MHSAALPESLDRRLVDAYRAWHALEKAWSGIEIVDFDLAAPRAVPAAASRDHVAEALTALLQEVVELPRPFSLAEQRLRASLAYLRALGGERLAFGDYVRVTLGASPIVIEEAEIGAQRQAVDTALANLKPLHRGGGPIHFRAEDLHRFQALFLYPNPGNLPRLFEFYRDKWLPLLLERLDMTFDPSMVQIEFAKEDAYWKNWITGNLAEQRVVLRINYHPRHTWYQGAPEALVLHEYCGHAVQMASWYRRVSRGELPDFSGILTVHFPDQFILEGLAESLIHVLPDGRHLEPKTVVLKELNDHALMVWNNVHLIANEEDAAAAEAYASRHLPFTSRNTIRAEIRDRTLHPLFRSYQYVYGIGQRAFLRAFGVRDAAQRWSLLRRVYSEPMLPADFERLQPAGAS